MQNLNYAPINWHTSDSEILENSLNAREIGKVLGVSAIRVRQICGSQNNPTNTFGEPLKVDGVRGNRWAKRDVYQYALAKSIDVEPMPPLLPHKDGTPRYTQISELTDAYTFDTNNSFLSTNQAPDLKQVWIFVFEDTYRSQRKDAQRIFLVLPLYPTDFFGVHTALKACEQNASQIGFTADENSLVVTLPVVSSQHRHPLIAGIYGNNVTDVYFNDYLNDLICCIGWKGMPVWFSGLSTAANLIDWQEGHTKNLGVPIILANKWGLYSYAVEKANQGGELATSWRHMAQSLYEGMKFEINGESARYELAEPFYWAEKVILPAPEIDLSEKLQDDYYEALIELINNNSSPRILAETALEYFGDIEYSRPQSALWSNIPPHWQDAIRGEAKEANSDFVNTVRARRLVQEFTKYFPSESVHPTIYEISQHGYYIAGSEGFSWISWLGYQRENPQSIHDALANVWPQDTLNLVVFISSLDSSVAVWAQTTSGDAVPFPTLTPNGLKPDVVTVLVLGVPLFEPTYLSKFGNITSVHTGLKAGQFIEYSAHNFKTKFGNL